MPDAKLRCIQVRFDETPIVKFGWYRPLAQEESDAMLADVGPEPHVHKDFLTFTVSLFVPWFSDEEEPKVQMRNLTRWCREAQEAILRLHPGTHFEFLFRE